ncbi:hypothetical protein ENHYD8BJ_130236 [Enhydrobacter sp. 8BJ]|nr:hypothetical protein ENHYD8BJ_130236 [Enhydrobacter sp. 8BJ]
MSFFIPIVTVFLREYDNSFFVLIDNLLIKFSPYLTVFFEKS